MGRTVQSTAASRLAQEAREGKLATLATLRWAPCAGRRAHGGQRRHGKRDRPAGGVGRDHQHILALDGHGVVAVPIEQVVEELRPAAPIGRVDAVGVGGQQRRLRPVADDAGEGLRLVAARCARVSGISPRCLGCLPGQVAVSIKAYSTCELMSSARCLMQDPSNACGRGEGKLSLCSTDYDVVSQWRAAGHALRMHIAS